MVSATPGAVGSKRHQATPSFAFLSTLPTLLVSLLLVAAGRRGAVVNALMPPHPDFADEFGSLNQYRERMNITFNYKLRYLSNPEHCRFLTEEKCRQEDEAYGLGRERHLEKQRQRQLRRLSGRAAGEGGSGQQQRASLRGDLDARGSNGTTSSRQLNPAEGDFRALVLLVRFPEHKDRKLSDIGYLDKVFNGKGVIEDINPAGSISEYVYYASLKNYRITFDFQEWDTAPNPESYYGGGEFGRRGWEVMQEVFNWKLEKMDQAGFDFGPYDVDGDGKLDQLIILHSGFAAELGSLRCHKEPENRIWSQAIADTGGQAWKGTKSGIELGGYAMASAIGLKGLCGEVPPDFEMGILTHEMMHTFYLPDTYDMDMDDVRVFVGDSLTRAHARLYSPFAATAFSPL